jgi:rare lipoprotein A
VSSINNTWRAGSGAHRFCCHPRKVSFSGMPVALRLLAAALTAAALAACAQRPPVMTSSRPAVQESAGKAVARHRAPSVVARYHAPPASEKSTAGTKGAGYGLASFYSYDPHTASGEKFDKNELTAAHRTLPFGTRLRVTDVDTGRSVTVRVNDRGPFVRGRVVDVSASAAETLGITGKGVAKVKVDVVEAGAK